MSRCSEVHAGVSRGSAKFEERGGDISLGRGGKKEAVGKNLGKPRHVHNRFHCFTDQNCFSFSQENCSRPPRTTRRAIVPAKGRFLPSSRDERAQRMQKTSANDVLFSSVRWTTRFSQLLLDRMIRSRKGPVAFSSREPTRTRESIATTGHSS